MVSKGLRSKKAGIQSPVQACLTTFKQTPFVFPLNGARPGCFNTRCNRQERRPRPLPHPNDGPPTLHCALYRKSRNPTWRGCLLRGHGFCHPQLAGLVKLLRQSQAHNIAQAFHDLPWLPPSPSRPEKQMNQTLQLLPSDFQMIR